MITSLSFDSRFQSGLLFLLTNDQDFFNLVIEDLEPQHFSAGEGYIKLFKVIKNRFKTSKKHPTVKVLKNLLIGLKDSGHFSDPELYGLNSILEIGQTLAHSEYEFIKEHVFDFLRKQTVALAFAKSIEFFDADDYDQMYDILGKAYKKSYGVGETLGYNYLQSPVPERYLEAPRLGVWSSGFPKFDAYIGGGFAEKECYSVLSATGRGKCLGENTPVLLSNGTIKMVQNIVTGDKLMGPDGKSRNVLSTASGVDELYKITPVKGEPYIVNSVHLLSLKKTSGTGTITLIDGTKIKEDNKNPIFIQAKDLFNSSKTVKHTLKGWRPEAVSFENESSEHPIPPYILGIWLGDGDSAGPRITQLNNEVITEFKNYASTLECSITECKDKRSLASNWTLISNSKKHYSNIFNKHLTQLNLINNKHIPNNYKMSSRQARLELLAGLLDTDGSNHYDGFDFIQKDKKLAEDVVFLCSSLGLAAYITECTKTIKSIGFSGQYWRVGISGDCSVIPLRLTYKKAAIRRQKKDVLKTGISIEKAGSGNYYGFEIDGDKQFLLGDWQVTHNTALLCNFAAASLREKRRTLFISLEMTDKVIMQRTDSILMGFSASEISENPELQIDLDRMIKKIKAPNFTIKEFQRGAITVNQVENFIDRYCDEVGKPDTIIVDWLGCFKFPVTRESKKHELMGEAADQLVNLSRKYTCSLLTAHQTNRQAVGNDEFGYDSVSESFASLFGMDGVFGLGASDKAKDAGKRTLKILKNRSGPDSVFVRLQGDLPNKPLTFKFVEMDEEEEKELLESDSAKKS